MKLVDYSIFKDKAYRVLIFDRQKFEAAPRGPKGKPIFIFECDNRAHQEDLAKCFRLLRKALVDDEGRRWFSKEVPKGPVTKS